MKRIADWNWEKEREFCSIAATKTPRELANEFNLSYAQVYSLCQRRGIKPLVKKYRKWKEEEVKSMETTQPLKLAEQLGIKPHLVHQRKRTALRKGQIENRWRDNQELPKISDEQLENVESNYCRKCKHENRDKSCRILTRAYNEILPKNWKLDRNPVCDKFEKCERR